MDERKSTRSARKAKADGQTSNNRRRQKATAPSMPTFTLGEMNMDLNPGQVRLMLDLVGEFSAYVQLPEKGEGELTVLSDAPGLIPFMQQQLSTLASHQAKFERLLDQET